MSGYSVPGIVQGYNCDAAGVTKFMFVKFTAEGVIGPVAASTDVAVGVTLFSVSTTEQTRGKGVSVMHTGIAEVEVGTGGLVAGQLVMSDTTGKAIVLATTGNRCQGVCVRGASAGQRGAVLLKIPGHLL